MTRPPAGPVLDAGLQRERTTLAWTRTVLGLLANGVLVLLRHRYAFPLGPSVALTSGFVVVALVGLWHAHRRSGVEHTADDRIEPATAAVLTLGGGLVLLSLGLGAAIVAA